MNRLGFLPGLAATGFTFLYSSRDIPTVGRLVAKAEDMGFSTRIQEIIIVRNSPPTQAATAPSHLPYTHYRYTSAPYRYHPHDPSLHSLPPHLTPHTAHIFTLHTSHLSGGLLDGAVGLHVLRDDRLRPHGARHPRLGSGLP